MALSCPRLEAEEEEGGRSGGRLTPGGRLSPLASKIWTVRRPGLRVESEVGFVFDVDAAEDEDNFSADVPLWLGLVIVPLDCLVVAAGDGEDPRVVSFNSNKNSGQQPVRGAPKTQKVKEAGREVLFVSFQDMAQNRGLDPLV